MTPIEFSNKLIMNKQLIAQITLNPVTASCSLIDLLNNFLLIYKKTKYSVQTRVITPKIENILSFLQ